MTIFSRYIKAARMSLSHFNQLRNNHAYLQWLEVQLPKLNGFVNKYEGKDCFIIGNGPSLNKMDLAPLSDFFVFGLNKIYLILEKQHIDFSFLVAVNPLVIEQSKAVYEAMGIPVFLAQNGSEDVNAPHIHKLRTKGGFNFSKNFFDEMNEGFTVTYVAIQLAYIMGFKRVFLIGVDHNFQQSGTPNSEQEMKTEDVNHFHPDYFKGHKWHLADVEGNEIAYRVARKEFNKENRSIYNSTVGGKLEVFERLPFEDAIKIAIKK